VPVPAASAGSGTTLVGKSEGISGLASGTTYHYRLVASSAVGTTIGADKTFSTTKPPKVLVGTATGITATEATLHGEVNPEGSATAYVFSYGETTSYGSLAPKSPASMGSGTSYVAVSQTITGLKPATTYHYNVAAQNALGIGVGTDKTFTTKP
jgi:phosphodiesterase/alkaline phosphatase D-like protein